MRSEGPIYLAETSELRAGTEAHASVTALPL